MYLYALIPLTIIIIKALQQNTTKKFKINGDETDEGKPNSMEFDENIENVKQSSFEGSVALIIFRPFFIKFLKCSKS